LGILRPEVEDQDFVFHGCEIVADNPLGFKTGFSVKLNFLPGLMECSGSIGCGVH
jgi:hypothetical protein